jgi:hypothetical protein
LFLNLSKSCVSSQRECENHFWAHDRRLAKTGSNIWKSVGCSFSCFPLYQCAWHHQMRRKVERRISYRLSDYPMNNCFRTMSNDTFQFHKNYRTESTKDLYRTAASGIVYMCHVTSRVTSDFLHHKVSEDLLPELLSRTNQKQSFLEGLYVLGVCSGDSYGICFVTGHPPD